jgi:hypothetical protein
MCLRQIVLVNPELLHYLNSRRNRENTAHFLLKRLMTSIVVGMMVSKNSLYLSSGSCMSRSPLNTPPH